MQIVTTWVQSDTFEPNNPNQQMREAMVGQGGDGGYASFYWDRVPNPPNSGLLGALRGPSMSPWVKVLLGGLALVAVGGAAFGVTRMLKKG